MKLISGLVVFFFFLSFPLSFVFLVFEIQKATGNSQPEGLPARQFSSYSEG